MRRNLIRKLQAGEPLFPSVLAGHAATAIFSAKIYSTSARKLTTLQGFLDMLKAQPAK